MPIPEALGINAGTSPSTPATLNVVDWIALILMIVGGLDRGLVGAFDFDLVATLFGAMSGLSQIVYILVGVSALYGVFLVTRLARRI